MKNESDNGTDELKNEVLKYLKMMYSNDEIVKTLKINKETLIKIKKQLKQEEIWNLVKADLIKQQVKKMAIDGYSIEQVSTKLKININFVKKFYERLERYKIIKHYNYETISVIKSKYEENNYSESNEKSKKKNQQQAKASISKEEQIVNIEIINCLHNLFSELETYPVQKVKNLKKQNIDPRVKEILERLKIGKMQKGDIRVIRNKVSYDDINKVTFKAIIRTFLTRGYLKEVVDFIDEKEKEEDFFNLTEKAKYSTFKKEINRINKEKEIRELLKKGKMTKSEIARKTESREIDVAAVERKFGMKSVIDNSNSWLEY